MATANIEDLKYVTEIKTEEEFKQLLKYSKAILYFQVDWAGQELMSRRLLTKALWEIGVLRIPVFKINGRDQDQIYVEEWLLVHGNDLEFYYGGLGATLLIEAGYVVDYIRYPVQLGLEKLKEKIKSWQ